MIRTRIEVENCEEVRRRGAQVGRLEARRPTPAKLAPRANARSFVRTVLTPIISAAVSSSRIAPQARPMRERSRLRATTIAMTTRAIPK